MRNVEIAMRSQLVMAQPTCDTKDNQPEVIEEIWLVRKDWILPAFCLIISNVWSIFFSQKRKSIAFSIYG
jgi:hypothetical protein